MGAPGLGEVTGKGGLAEGLRGPAASREIPFLRFLQSQRRSHTMSLGGVTEMFLGHQ